MELTVATLTSPDAEQVTSWVPSRTDVTLFGGSTLPHPLTGEALLATKADGWTLLSFRQDDVLVATGSYRVKAPGLARIGRVLVAPDRRGRGVGRDVMSALLLRTESLPGITAVELGVFEHNVRAIKLYESLGFVDSGERVVIKTAGEVWTSLQMRKLI